MTESLPGFVTTGDIAKFLANDHQSILNQVQARVRQYCRWHISPNITETQIIDGRGSSILRVRSLLVTDVLEVKNEGVVVDPSEYDWSEDGFIELRTGGWWSRRPRQVEVTLEHGYEDPPLDVVGVIVAIASRAASSPAGVVQEAVGAVSRGYAQIGGSSGGFGAIEQELQTLDLYRIANKT